MNTIRAHTLLILQKNDVPLHPDLPQLDNIKLKTKEQVCERIVALYALTGLANEADGELLKEWLIDENGWGYLLKDEQLLIEKPNLTTEEINELSWK